MARHVLVDLAYVVRSDPTKDPDRLPEAKLQILVEFLSKNGMELKSDQDSLTSFQATRALYEPFLNGLSQTLIMELPEWISSTHLPDNWQTSAWDGSHF
jgi:hypothetical protein